jgi:hypothetical protein
LIAPAALPIKKYWIAQTVKLVRKNTRDLTSFIKPGALRAVQCIDAPDGLMAFSRMHRYFTYSHRFGQMPLSHQIPDRPAWKVVFAFRQRSGNMDGNSEVIQSTRNLEIPPRSAKGRGGSGKSIFQSCCMVTGFLVLRTMMSNLMCD